MAELNLRGIDPREPRDAKAVRELTNAYADAGWAVQASKRGELVWVLDQLAALSETNPTNRYAAHKFAELLRPFIENPTDAEAIALKLRRLEQLTFRFRDDEEVMEPVVQALSNVADAARDPEQVERADEIVRSMYLSFTDNKRMLINAAFAMQRAFERSDDEAERAGIVWELEAVLSSHASDAFVADNLRTLLAPMRRQLARAGQPRRRWFGLRG